MDLILVTTQLVSCSSPGFFTCFACFFFVFLQRIRTALRSVRDEIRTMDLRMGVLQSQILSLQMRGVRKQRVGRK